MVNILALCKSLAESPATQSLLLNLMELTIKYRKESKNKINEIEDPGFVIKEEDFTEVKSNVIADFAQ